MASPVSRPRLVKISPLAVTSEVPLSSRLPSLVTALPRT